MALLPSAQSKRFPGSFARWPNRRPMVALASAIICFSSHSTPIRAQNAAEPLTRADLQRLDTLLGALQRALEQRDALIREFLRRVEQLERAVAVDEAPPTARIVPAAKTSPTAEPASPPAPRGPNHPETTQSQAPAPGRVEVDEEEGERALDFTLVEQGAFLLPAGRAEITPRFSYTRRTFRSSSMDGWPSGTCGATSSTSLQAYRSGYPASPNTSLSLVLNQSFIDEFKVDGQSVDGSDQVQSVLTFGASAILGRNVLLDGAVGVGLTDDSPDYSVSISLPIRFSTPGL
jgi:hypothetical protein